MKTNVILLAVVACILTPCATAAGADDLPAVTVSDSSRDDKASAEARKGAESERRESEYRKRDGDSAVTDREQKLRLEYRARMEAVRRDRLERMRRGQHYHNDPFAFNTVVVAAPEITAVSYSTDSESPNGVYRDYPRAETRSAQSIGIVLAPPQAGNAAAVGFQWMGPRMVGATVWLSGRLDRGEDVIDGSIPHEDYYIESRKGTYGMQVTRGFGPPDSMLVLGAGLSVRQTLYNAVSNVTGWKWNAGESYSTRLSGQIGMKFQVGDRINLHFGYDTAHYGFIGFSANF